MVREHLITTIREMVEHLGYAFFSGANSAIMAQLNEFPAVWLEPLTIKSLKGQVECRVVYHASLHMAMLTSHNDISAESIWEVLEIDAINLYHKLSSSEWVQSVDNFTLTPSQVSLTRCGDASVNIELDIEMFYCN